MTLPVEFFDTPRFTLTHIELEQVLKHSLEPNGERERFLLVAGTQGLVGILSTRYAVLSMATLDSDVHPHVWEVCDSGIWCRVLESPFIQALWRNEDGSEYTHPQIMQKLHGVPINMTLTPSWLSKLGWQ